MKDDRIDADEQTTNTRSEHQEQTNIDATGRELGDNQLDDVVGGAIAAGDTSDTGMGKTAGNPIDGLIPGRHASDSKSGGVKSGRKQ